MQSAAGTIQEMSSPPVGVVGWLGVRFEVMGAELPDEGLIFRDAS